MASSFNILLGINILHPMYSPSNLAGQHKLILLKKSMLPVSGALHQEKPLFY